MISPMINALARRILQERPASLGRGRRPAVPAGTRVYATGDVHGRIDLLERLLHQIEGELKDNKFERVLLIFLGDLIDRGPSSREVLDRLSNLEIKGVDLIFLTGNHEEMVLKILEGDAEFVSSWLKFGGKEFLESYDIDYSSISIERRSNKHLVEIMNKAMAGHVGFLRSFRDAFGLGDYFFAHAGVMPGVSLQHQIRRDLRWIREPFLSFRGKHEKVIVHGHTISREVDEKFNRIGIDTGAYISGVLTTLVLEGSERRYISTKIPESS